MTEVVLTRHTTAHRMGRICTGRIAAALLCSVLLAGCAGTRPAQITTFHRAEQSAQAWQGKRFVVQPLAGQADSLEYSNYAGRVRQALQKHGLEPVAVLGAADYAVSFQYGSGGTLVTEGRVSSSRFSMGVGGGSHFGWGLGVGIPIGGTSEPDTYYRHQLQVFINRVRHADGQGSSAGERVYESSIVTNSDSAAVSSQMPVMIDALFADFPGENGRTRTVSLPRAGREDR
ncbi:MAG: DUF4136 domain-containing protein [Lautropia sp.]|nr:DUF4136 domain-containing protein [Lautropia sp.]